MHHDAHPWCNSMSNQKHILDVGYNNHPYSEDEKIDLQLMHSSSASRGMDMLFWVSLDMFVNVLGWVKGRVGLRNKKEEEIEKREKKKHKYCTIPHCPSWPFPVR